MPAVFVSGSHYCKLKVFIVTTVAISVLAYLGFLPIEYLNVAVILEN